MRAALYWAPALDDPLRAAGDAWLGRDAETSGHVAQPDVSGIAAMTAAPRVYGFHATLRPPMGLAVSYAGFRQAARRVAARHAAFALPRLELASLGGFLALRLAAPCPALQALADDCVAETDLCRAPAGAEEMARRRALRLSPAEEAMLVRWGYPYVMNTWQFHMTLTRQLSDADMHDVLPRAQAHFAAALAVPRHVAALCLFTQREPGADFLIAERIGLTGSIPG